MTLLQTVKLPGGVKGTPLFVEIPVHEDSAPYLVTSNKGPLWIEESLKGVVRSALIKVDPMGVNNHFRQVVQYVLARGVADHWGNDFPNTPQGRAGAEAYLRSYGLEPTELIAHDEGTNSWVPEGCAVLVPKDRSYLGIVGELGEGAHTVVVHNPSRGMAVLGAW